MNIAAARIRREKEMALRNVVTDGDPILRKKCREPWIMAQKESLSLA